MLSIYISVINILTQVTKFLSFINIYDLCSNLKKNFTYYYGNDNIDNNHNNTYYDHRLGAACLSG